MLSTGRAWGNTVGASTEKVSLQVTVDDQHSDRLAEVAERLRAAGMRVESLLEALGTITGSIESSKVKLISSVKGVSHVETSRQFQLAPPDSKIQ